jgi:hypothetical protein
VRACACLLTLAGCLGEATFSSHDLSASVVDLAPVVDQGNKGDGGKLYNCVQLNSCERACAGDPKPPVCIANCRTMASQAAVMKEMALQGCFGQYCPQATDAGAAALCTQTDAGFSPHCLACISNSQVAPMNLCDVDLGTSTECHQCYDAAIACENDN